MGCDIHLAVQRLCDGKWCDVPENQSTLMSWTGNPTWYDARSYIDFSILAGVRGDLRPISEPRGWPDSDVPSQFLSDIELEPFEQYLHSASWLLLKELDGAPEWEQGDAVKSSYFYGDVLPALRAYAQTHDLKPDELRIVFAFDS